MSKERKQEIIDNLMEIYENFEPVPDMLFYEPEMFWLIMEYNNKYDNEEIIGGRWVIENAPSPLKDLD